MKDAPLQQQPNRMGLSKSSKPPPPVPQKTQTSISNSKLNDLYSTFKDDMQRMNERTYARANGVKVCKVSFETCHVGIL